MSPHQPTEQPRHCYLETPIGRLRLVASAHALQRVDHLCRPLPVAGPLDPDWPLLREASEQLREYFAGRRQSFTLPLEPIGTAFQREAWQALATIAHGELRSYAEQARAVGRPSAVRAIGAANGRNPLSIVLPCHRVIGSDGSLTGYAGGLPAKRWLLRHEGVVLGEEDLFTQPAVRAQKQQA